MAAAQNDAVFWRTIDRARRAGADARERAAALKRDLATMPPAERAGFSVAAAGWHAALDREGLWIAAAAMMGFCSDDGFADFREWLLLQGRERVEAAVRDPDAMADWNVNEPPTVTGSFSSVARALEGERFDPDTRAWPGDARATARTSVLTQVECAVRCPRLWARANDPASFVLALIARAEWTSAARVTDALIAARAGAPGVALFLRGVAAFERADWAAAVGAFREADDEQPRSPALAFALADAVYREADAAAPVPQQGDAHANAEAICAFFDARPREHEALFRRALALHAAGETTPIDEAAKRLSGMLRVDWERAAIWASE